MTAARADARADAPAVIRSVDRAIDVLEYLAERDDGAVTDLAAALGVHKSTAFRLLAVLEARGLVEQVSERGRYRLGFGLVRLAGVTAARLDLVEQSRPITRRLALEIGETVNVARLEAEAVVNVDQVRGSAAVTTHNWVGQRTPLHATSSGKVLLAYLDRAHAGPAPRRPSRAVHPGDDDGSGPPRAARWPTSRSPAGRPPRRSSSWGSTRSRRPSAATTAP